MQAEEINRLPWCVESEARVSEHHDAESHYYDCNNSFCVHFEVSVLRFGLSAPSDDLAAGKEVDENHDDGDDQQDMDKPAEGVTTQHAEQPENDQYDCDCV